MKEGFEKDATKMAAHLHGFTGSKDKLATLKGYVGEKHIPVGPLCRYRMGVSDTATSCHIIMIRT